MAQTARYASRTAVFGNVAYDLESLKRNFDSTAYAEPERVYAPEPETAERPKTAGREKARTRARADARAEGVTVSFFSVVGFAVAAVMLVFVILSYVQITEINDTKSALRTELAALNVEAEQLRVRYETTFNLNEIEDYAEHTLGMVRLTDGSTSVVSSGRADTGVVLSDGGGESSAISGLVGYLHSLLEYFK